MNSEKIQQLFFSSENFEMLQQLIVEQFQKKYPTLILSADMDKRIKDTLTRSMRQSFYDNNNGNINLKDLCKTCMLQTLTSVNSYVALQTTAQQPPQNIMHPKERQQSAALMALRPMVSVLTEEQATGVATRFQQLAEERKQDAMKPPDLPTFQDTPETVNHQAVLNRFEEMKKIQQQIPVLTTTQSTTTTTKDGSGALTTTVPPVGQLLESFQEMNKEMDKQRSQELLQHEQEVMARNEEFSRFQLLQPHSQLAPQSTPITIVAKWDPDSRNMQDELMHQEPVISNKEWIEEIQRKIELEKKQAEEKRQQQTNLPQDYLIQHSGLYSYDDSYLELSSGDRNFTQLSTENCFSFSIYFNSSGTDTVSNAGVPCVIRNVVKIRLNYLQLFYPQSVFGDDMSYDNINNRMFYNFPYLLLSIPELASKQRSTNDLVNKSYIKLIQDKQTVFPNQVNGFINYIPATKEECSIYDTPLASLNKLTFKITTPTGQPFSTAADWSYIAKLIFTADTTTTPYLPCIVLQLQNFVYSEFFVQSQTIVLKNLETVTGLSSEIIGFLTNDYGHKIYQITRSDGHYGNGGYNDILIDQIWIQNEAVVDLQAGAGTISYITVPDQTLNPPTSDTTFILSSSTSYVVNMAIQTNLSFTVTTKQDSMREIPTQII